MTSRAVAWALLIGVSLLAVLPVSSAHPTSFGSVAGVTATVPPPLHGSVTNCTTASTCVYAFSNSHGTGWANSTGASPLVMALQLPGEAKGSYGLTYSTYTEKVTTAYPSTTYWTVGSFLGTDVNTGHIVLGTTNTNYTATCHPVFRWCHYTYQTDNGTIVVRFTHAEVTSTSVSCSPTFTHPGGKVACTVTVTNGWNATNYPVGKVKISSGGTGAVSGKGSCALTSGGCSFTYVPADDTCGAVTLLATYPGNAAYYPSSGSIGIDVYVSGGC